MNRSVSEEEIRNLIGRLRREIPGIILRTSLMVGFPGETKKRYEKLLRFVEETRFDRLGVFTYSREDGTPAASLKGQVSEKIKAGRYHEIMALQKQISRQKQKELLGSRMTGRVEGPGRTGSVLWEGRTQGQAPDGGWRHPHHQGRCPAGRDGRGPHHQNNRLLIFTAKSWPPPPEPSTDHSPQPEHEGGNVRAPFPFLACPLLLDLWTVTGTVDVSFRLSCGHLVRHPRPRS